MQVEGIRQQAGSLPWQPLWLSLRPHQWLKSLLLFAPLAAAHRLHDWQLVLQCAMAFLAFSMVSSALYLANDVIDRDRDRHHPLKGTRPISRGVVPVGMAVGAALLLGGLALAVAIRLPGAFLFWMLLYAALVLGYSFLLKHVMFMDLAALTGFYLLRIVAGGSAVAIQPSGWMLLFAACLFLNLALVKRYQDLLVWHRQAQAWPLSCRQYAGVPAGLLARLGGLTGAAAILVLALYLATPLANSLYPGTVFIWIFPLLLAGWIGWMWHQAAAGGMGDDPVLFAVRDVVSRTLLAAICLVIGVGALL